MGGRGAFTAGKQKGFIYKMDTTASPDGKWEGVKILIGTEESGKHGLPEESHSSWAYIKLKQNGVFHEMRIYDKDHYLIKEIAYHPEPTINNGNTRDNVLHVHEYPEKNNLKYRPAHLITKEEYQEYKKFFKGVPEIVGW